MLDIFVRFEAMNFSTYSGSPVEKRRKLIPCVYLLSTPDHITHPYFIHIFILFIIKSVIFLLSEFDKNGSSFSS